MASTSSKADAVATSCAVQLVIIGRGARVPAVAGGAAPLPLASGLAAGAAPVDNLGLARRRRIAWTNKQQDLVCDTPGLPAAYQSKAEAKALLVTKCTSDYPASLLLCRLTDVQRQDWCAFPVCIRGTKQLRPATQRVTHQTQQRF